MVLVITLVQSRFFATVPLNRAMDNGVPAAWPAGRGTVVKPCVASVGT